jgi:flavin reductase (DIM6/NTAB) family NADH-FMN oxidoreductase RutF
MHYETAKNNHGLRFNPFKALVVPRPIGWISTRNAAGELNLAPYSFFNGISDQPPMVTFSVGGRKDTLRNIEETRDCTCSLATMALRDSMNLSSATVDADVDEFALAGLETADCELVSTPRVAASPAAFECRYWKSMPLPRPDPDVDFCFNLVICEVIGVYIDESYIKDGIVDIASMQPIARLGYMDYSVVNEDSMFTLNRPEVSADGKQAAISGKPWDGVYR